MNGETIIAVVLAAVGGGGLTAVANYFIAKVRGKSASGTLTHEHYKDLLDRYREEIEELTQIRDEFNAYKIKTSQEITGLYQKIELLESAHQDMPFPMWLKDKKGIVLAVNMTFEEKFLLPLGKTMDDYIGHTDEAIWSKEEAKMMRAADLRVFNSGITYDQKETLMFQGEEVSFRVIKYVRYSGNTKIGIGGLTLPWVDLEKV